MNHRIAAAIALVLLPGALAAQSWLDVLAQAEPVRLQSGAASVPGDVREGFASYLLDVESPGEITVDVEVTQVREGIQYEDDDSVLFLLDTDGYLIAENDDDSTGWESLIQGAVLPERGTYVIVVTTHPRFIETDDAGYFTGFTAEGLSSIGFTLGIQTDAGIAVGPSATTGPPDGAAPQPGDGGQPQREEYTFEDVVSEATPLAYAGARTAASGRVASGIAAFRISPETEDRVDMEVLVTREVEGADSILTVVDEDGTVLAEDDDGGNDRASLATSVDLNPETTYYAVVTSWPNYPNYQEDDTLAFFTSDGGDQFEFELVVRPADQATQAGVPDADESAESFRELTETASVIDLEGSRATGTGEVAAGYEAFEIVVNEPSEVTLEVVITGVYPGLRYEDQDSMLSVYNAEGRLIASDDDGGEMGASRISNLWLSRAGRYYAVVTTFPNDGEIDDDGYFSRMGAEGGSFITFDLVATRQ